MNNNQRKELPAGTKYLSLSIEILGQKYNIAAFPNNDKRSDKEPDFKSKDVAVWIREKKGRLDPLKMLGN